MEQPGPRSTKRAFIPRKHIMLVIKLHIAYIQKQGSGIGMSFAIFLLLRAIVGSGIEEQGVEVAIDPN